MILQFWSWSYLQFSGTVPGLVFLVRYVLDGRIPTCPTIPAIIPASVRQTFLAYGFPVLVEYRAGIVSTRGATIDLASR